MIATGLACLALLAGAAPVEEVVAPPRDTFPEELAGLRLDVSATLRDTWAWSGKWERLPATLVIEVAIRNVGDTPITVPTRPYLAWRNNKIHWSDHEQVWLFIEQPTFKQEQTVVNDATFAPVRLQQKEVTLLYRAVHVAPSLEAARRTTYLSARFHVAPRLAANRGWWSGTISRLAPIEKFLEEEPPDRTGK